MKLKKILLVSAIVAGGVFLLGGAGMMKTKWTELKQAFRGWVDENTSPEAEIARLKADVDEKEKKLKNSLAKEMAACERLDREIKELEVAVAKEEGQVRDLHAAIKASTDNKVSISTNSTPIKKADALKKLDAQTKTVAARQKELDSRKEALVFHNEQKTLLETTREELKAARAELETMAAECRALEAKGMKSNLSKDEKDGLRPQINKVKDKLAEKRILVGLDEEKVDDQPTLNEDEMIERINRK